MAYDDYVLIYSCVRQLFFVSFSPGRQAHVAQAVSHSPCCRGWPWTYDPLACTPSAAIIGVSTMHERVRDWTQSFKHIHQLSHSHTGVGLCSLCSPGCPKLVLVVQDGLELGDLPASAFQRDGIKGVHYLLLAHFKILRLEVLLLFPLDSISWLWPSNTVLWAPSCLDSVCIPSFCPT